MPFSQKELDIIKYGQANGKSRAEVEQALSNFRNGVKPQKEELQDNGLRRVADIYGKNLKESFMGGLERGAESFDQAGKYEEAVRSRDLSGMGIAAARGGLRLAGGVAQAMFSPVTAAVQTAAQGYSELDQATGGRVADKIKSIAERNPEVVQGVSEWITQNPEKVKDAEDILNFIGAKIAPKASSALSQTVEVGADTVGAGARAVKSTIGKVADISAFDAIKGSSGNLTQKAVDFISADPSDKVATILKRSTPEELDNYLAIAEKSAASGEAKSVFEAVGDKMFDATKELKTKLDGIGAAKSDVIAKNGTIDFSKQTTPFVSNLENILNSFTKIDEANAPIVQKFIADAKNVRTAQQADAFIDKAQDALYTGDRTMTLPKGSSLEKKLQRALGEYNTALKAVVPEEYSVLNKQYADLVGTLEVLNRGLGEVVEGTAIRGAGLVKQYFSPAASRTKELFEFIKKETDGRIDLAKDATLAKFAGQLYDDANVESLLGGIKDIPTTPSAVIGKVIEKVGGKQVTDALRRSTVLKAKSSTLPKESKAASTVDRKTLTEPKLLQEASPDSTPETVKRKGIRLNRGSLSLNPEDWFQEIANSAEVGLKAKTKELQLDMAKEAARTMRNNGVSVEVPNPKNAVEILKQAKELARKKKVSDIIQAETPSDKMKPFLEPKKNELDLLKSLTPKQLERFNAGTKEEQKKALEYLKLKNDLETNDAIIAPKKKVADSLEQEAKKYKSGVPKTVKIWNKSKFSNDGAYADVPVIRREDNITLYQGGSDGKRQFWTPDRKYAERFGEVKTKTGSFYKVDNGNRVTDVYVEVPKK